MARTKTTATATLAAALRTARADLDDLRDRLAALDAERADVEAMPVDETEAAKRVDALIAQARASGPLWCGALFNPSSGYTLADAERYAGGDKANTFATFAALAPDALRAHMLAQAPKGGIAPAERARRLAEIEEAAWLAAIAEESTCRDIEDCGVTIARRTDAPPAVLVATDASLGRDVQEAA